MSENKEKSENYTVVKFRFIELLLFMFVSIMTQIIWVTFAPIMSESAAYYSVDESLILLLAASYMIAYIPLNFPANYALDKLGLKKGVGIGVILTGVFGFLRPIAGTNFTFLLICQLMCAIGQPFVLNSYTKMAAMWFAKDEKVTASGLCTISTLIGAIIGMMVPELASNLNINALLYVYGILALISMILFLIFAREKPPTPPNEYADKTKAFVTTGLRDIFKIKDFNYLLVLLFIGLGIFNALTSEIDLIFDPLWDAGLISGAMIIGGVLGAIILSSISDQKHKRKIFLQIAMIAAVPLTLMLAIFKNFELIIVISLIFGFLLVSAMPVGMTYAAEITYPIPEETSNGLLMTLGQIGGLLFLLIPPEFFMYASSALFAVGAVFSSIIKDVDYHEKKRFENK